PPPCVGGGPPAGERPGLIGTSNGLMGIYGFSSGNHRRAAGLCLTTSASHPAPCKGEETMTDNDLLPQIIAPIVSLAVAFCVFLVLVGLWHAVTGRRRA